jgi:hypothetical protein
MFRKDVLPPFQDIRTLKMEVVRLSESFVAFYQTARYEVPQDRLIFRIFEHLYGPFA